MTKQVYFFDTSLRDGEQTPGVSFHPAEKVQLALQLEKWGIDVIEAGFPISSNGDFEAVKAIAASVKHAAVTALARCTKADIDCVEEALQKAKNPQIHLFIATSPIHRQHKLKLTKQEVLASVKKHVTYASQKFEKVQFSPEDATRTEWDFLVEVIELAIQCGATVINIPDTVGYTNPAEYGALFRHLKERVVSFDKAIFSSHCHDDLGMATANALAAIENGALRVEGTINGIGERAGNTALEEVAAALYIRRDHYKAASNIVLKETKNTSELVSRLAGVPVPRNKAVIGSNAYAHESGIHQDGILKHPTTYEIITPKLVGVEKSELPLGKLSGRHAFAERMEALGYDMSHQEEVNALFVKFKALADKKKKISTVDLHALAAGKQIEDRSRYELVKLQVQSIEEGVTIATVAVQDRQCGDKFIQDSATGSGSVDAIYQTVNQIIDQDVRLCEYRIDAITEGQDAQAQVHVTIETENGFYTNGTGIDFDVLNASAKAYLQAIR